MASKYTTGRAIPIGFPDVLRDFSREVLRNFPRDASGPADSGAWIYQFAADYFAAGGRPASKAEEIKIDRVITSETRHAVAAVLEHGSTGAIGELEEFISVIFNRADKDGSGALDTREFKNCVLSVAQQVGLQQADVRLLMSMADSSSDGYIQYHEFLPVALQLIGLIVAKASHKEEVDEVRRRAEDEAQHKLIHGMSREEVYERLMKAFTAADTDADGLLSREELQRGLQSTALGLSRRDINLLISEADVDGSGHLNFSEFAPLCYSLLAESIAKQVQIQLLPWDVAALARRIVTSCQEFDTNGTGHISASQLQQALQEADMHLNWLQIQTIASEALITDGGVAYADFAVSAAGLIRALLCAQVDAEAASRMIELRSNALVNGMDRETLTSSLFTALEAVDPEGTGRAQITDVKSVLRESMRFDEKQSDSLIAGARAVSEQEDRTIDINFLVQFAFDALVQLMELDMLRSNP